VVPAAEVLGDVIVVAMRLVGDPGRRAEMDPARDRPPGRLVDHGDVHPVAARFRQLEADLAGLGPAVALEVAQRTRPSSSSPRRTATVADGRAAIDANAASPSVAPQPGRSSAPGSGCG
jgi:hypothetical protein